MGPPPPHIWKGFCWEGRIKASPPSNSLETAEIPRAEANGGHPPSAPHSGDNARRQSSSPVGQDPPNLIALRGSDVVGDKAARVAPPPSPANPSQLRGSLGNRSQPDTGNVPRCGAGGGPTHGAPPMCPQEPAPSSRGGNSSFKARPFQSPVVNSAPIASKGSPDTKAPAPHPYSHLPWDPGAFPPLPGAGVRGRSVHTHGGFGKGELFPKAARRIPWDAWDRCVPPVPQGCTRDPQDLGPAAPA